MTSTKKGKRITLEGGDKEPIFKSSSGQLRQLSHGITSETEAV